MLVDAPAPPARATRRRDWPLDVGVPVAIRAAEMLVQLLFLAWLNPAGGPSLARRLNAWDAAYYATIAAHGYPAELVIDPAGELTSGREFAFYPAYPVLAGLVHRLGVSTSTALLVTSAVCGCAASVAVHLLARELTGSRRAGYYAAGALGALPMAIAFQMGYAESLYVAVTAAALLAAFRGRWACAGGFALLAGLTRPPGILVPLTLPITAYLAARRPGAAAAPWPRIALATAVGFAGSPLYWGYLWAHTGNVDTWFQVQDHGWQSGIDFGAQTWDFLRLTIQHPDETQFMGVATVVSIVLVGLGCVLGVAGRRSPPLVVLVVLSAAMTLGATNYWHSKPRLLLACFPLVVLAAPVLTRLRTATAVSVVATAVLGSAWFGAYALDIWPYAV